MNATTYDIGHPAHERWLAAEAGRLLDFYQDPAADRSGGGFWWLDSSGRPMPEHGKQLWINARMVHAFGIGALAGRTACRSLVEHGVEFLRAGPLHDPTHGGWMWAVDATGEVVDDAKQAYGHAFVLLAVSSAEVAGVDTGPIRDEIATLIDEKYWREADGLCVDTYDRSWSDLERYRGQNANMHLVEAFLAAAEATGDAEFSRRGSRIAERIIDELTRANGWRVAEHYDESWRILRDYYVVDWDGAPLNRHRYHWVVAEAIGAAAMLHRATGEPGYQRWYAAFWEHAERFHADRERGSWHHELDDHNRPTDLVWDGKPDLYHALQATYFARIPLDEGIAAALARDRVPSGSTLSMTRADAEGAQP